MTEKNTASKARKLSEFRATFDKSYKVPLAIRDALKRMDGDWMYEVEFAKHAGIPLNDLAAFRDQFAAKHVIIIRSSERKVWARTEAVKKAMENML